MDSIARELYISPIIAWRAWDLLDCDGIWTLRSCTSLPSSLFNWPVGVPYSAFCYARGCEQSPDISCNCGIYAVKEQELLQWEGYRWSFQGQVYLWGLVVEAEKGYRAQYAYPKTLFPPTCTYCNSLSEIKCLYGYYCNKCFERIFRVCKNLGEIIQVKEVIESLKVGYKM